MVLRKRIMWPKQGEQVTIFEHGEVIVEGHVLYSGMDEINILCEDATTKRIGGKMLSDGIDDGSITIKKQSGWKGQDI